MLRYGATIFLSAFLLFEVQLILAKRVLPWFGGAPAVWTTCMLFFQLLLLAGYAYAHGLAAHLSAPAQRRLHLALLGASLVLLAILWTAWGSPILPDAGWKPADSTNPVGRILILLGVSIGLPFFLLSATNPLLQAWFSRTHPGAPPWRLYALSNLGSLLGLLGYPFLLEWLLPLPAQAWAWTFGYVLFAAGIVASAAAAVSPAPTRTAPMAASPAPARASYLLWFALAAVASVLLLATTNQMTQEIAVIPFLWVLPLSLYLLSFILCFENERWYWRGPYAVALLLALAGIGVVLHLGVDLAIYLQVGAYAVLLFVACMTLHGELARLKPGADRLTAYYLTITAGGAAGGLFVALLAPAVFTGYWELHLGLWSASALLALVWWRERGSFLHRGGGVPAWVRTTLLGSVLLVYGAALAWLAYAPLAETVAQKRNFYGVLHVLEDSPDDEEQHRYRLMHGRITHGYQYQRWDLREEPTSYYGNDSGIGLTLLRHPRRPQPLRVGVVGLGAGSLAVYGNAGDAFRFYEINPDVVGVAVGHRALFSYLRDTRADAAVVLGDARLSLEHELARGEAARFDVLTVDAFSSDAIPVHLLTAEAIEIYLAHLRIPDGVLALHITNRYLDLEPVVVALAGRFGLTLRIVESESGARRSESTWALLARGDTLERIAGLAEAARPAGGISVAPWRDDYSNLFRIIKW